MKWGLLWMSAISICSRCWLKNLRRCHGSIWEVVCAVHTQALGRLLRGRDTVMLYVAVFEIRIESLEIDKIRDIGVSGGTMVTLIEVVG